jgi:hypothetical protein
MKFDGIARVRFFCYHRILKRCKRGGRTSNFFSILTFLIIILEMYPMKRFFYLVILSRANPSGVTYEGVTSVHLAWLKGQTRERWSTWRHVGWDDWVAPQQMTRLEDAPSCDACPPVAPFAVARLSCVSQIGETSSYLKLTPAFSSSLSLFISLAHRRPPPTSLMPPAFLRRLRPSNSSPQPLPS